jgi:hypothetical protein
MQALELDNCDATLYSNRSLCYVQIGKSQKALLDAHVCIARRPNWVKGYYRKGAAHMSLKVGKIMTLLVICRLVCNFALACCGSSVQFLFPRSTRKQLRPSWMDWNWIQGMPRLRKYCGNYSFFCTPTHVYWLVRWSPYLHHAVKQTYLS